MEFVLSWALDFLVNAFWMESVHYPSAQCSCHCWCSRFIFYVSSDHNSISTDITKPHFHRQTIKPNSVWMILYCWHTVSKIHISKSASIASSWWRSPVRIILRNFRTFRFFFVSGQTQCTIPNFNIFFYRLFNKCGIFSQLKFKDKWENGWNTWRSSELVWSTKHWAPEWIISTVNFLSTSLHCSCVWKV